jgi:hypothetical protein
LKKGVTYSLFINNQNVLQFNYRDDLIIDRIYYTRGGEYILDDVAVTQLSYEVNTSPSTTQETVLEEAALPKIYAMAVGINDYRQHYSNKKIFEADPNVSCDSRSLQLPCLNYIDNDAKGMYDFWASIQGGKVPESQLAVLIDDQATKQNIINTAAKLFSKARENDIILFYASGHGGVGIFCAADDDIEYEKLNAILSQSKAKIKVVMLDAYHAGSIDPVYKSKTVTPATDEELLSIFYEKLMKSGRNIAYLLSSRADENSQIHRQEPNSVFTHYLIKGLRGESDMDNDRLVTLGEIVGYLQNNVNDYVVKNFNKTQRPEIKGSHDNDTPIAKC